MHAGNSIWVLPQVEVESPLGRSRKSAVKHLDCVVVLCGLALTGNLYAPLVCTGLCILRNLHSEPEATQCAPRQHRGVCIGDTVSDKVLSVSIHLVFSTACETVSNHRLHKATDNIRCRNNALAILEFTEAVGHGTTVTGHVFVCHYQLKVNTLALPGCSATY